jgi:hypothetical protein
LEFLEIFIGGSRATDDICLCKKVQQKKYFSKKSLPKQQ